MQQYEMDNNLGDFRNSAVSLLQDNLQLFIIMVHNDFQITSIIFHYTHLRRSNRAQQKTPDYLCTFRLSQCFIFDSLDLISSYRSCN